MADQREFDTDAIIEVFGHVVKDSKSWGEFMAVHGMHPEPVSRAFQVIFENGDGRINTAVEAFVLGLQFGAMRLEPIAYDPEEQKPCQCLFCTLARAAEAEGGDEE